MMIWPWQNCVTLSSKASKSWDVTSEMFMVLQAAFYLVRVECQTLLSMWLLIFLPWSLTCLGRYQHNLATLSMLGTRALHLVILINFLSKGCSGRWWSIISKYIWGYFQKCLTFGSVCVKIHHHYCGLVLYKPLKVHTEQNRKGKANSISLLWCWDIPVLSTDTRVPGPWALAISFCWMRLWL